MSVDLDAIVAACRAVRHLTDAPQRIADLLGNAIAEPDALAAAVSARRQAGPKSSSMAQILLNDEDLTIYQLSFPPQLWGVPHDHGSWAVIGVYAGAEAFNVYEENNGGLTAIDRQLIEAGEVAVLPPDLIHDIENSANTVSGSIHVYGNRHFDQPDRRIWRSANENAEPFSLDKSFVYGMALTQQQRRARLTTNGR